MKGLALAFLFEFTESINIFKKLKRKIEIGLIEAL